MSVDGDLQGDEGDDRRPTRPLERYLEVRATVARTADEVGRLEFVLYEVDELAEGQIGYAVGADDEDLTGDGPGQWRPLWLVIGEEALTGETLLVDLEDDALAVMVAVEDEDGWGEPVEIASSLPLLAALLGELEAAARDRATPAELLEIALARTPDTAHAQWRAWLDGPA